MYIIIINIRYKHEILLAKYFTKLMQYTIPPVKLRLMAG